MLKLEYFAEVRLKIASRKKMVEGEDSLSRVQDQTKETVPSSAGWPKSAPPIVMIQTLLS